MSTANQQILLRAELTHVETLLTYALDLRRSSVFVVTDWTPPAGTLVNLKLSFLDLVTPIDLVARVETIRGAGNPGDQSGLVLSLDEDPRIDALIRKLERSLAAPIARKGRLLLIEDSGLTRDVFAYRIGANTFDVDHAEDAERGWQMLEANAYDLVVVDYFLPVATGAELIQRLRKEPKYARLPVIAISVGGRDACEAMMTAGADLFLDKPLALRDIANTLRVVVQRKELRNGKTILVFDDSPLVLDLMRATLEAEGYRVEVAADLRAFERHRASLAPDLILLDVQMPEVFGDDIAITLREWHDVKVPILLVSSLEESQLAERAAEAEADGYVMKSAGMPALVQRCKELLGGP
jgi:DNA-binding response OmpR family regulator